MQVFKKLTSQEKAVGLLESAYTTGRLAHAYLFTGIAGTGRLTAALELAAARVCMQVSHGYCGECRDCLRVFSFEHPDIRLTIPKVEKTTPEDILKLITQRVTDGISPIRIEGNASIRINQIREIEHRLSRKAFEGNGHIEIILEAEKMTHEAANALLKTLEEPPDNTIIILICSTWSHLLSTVRSRAHLIRFNRLDEKMIEDELMRRNDLSRKEATVFAVRADGSPGKALLLASGIGGQNDDVQPGDILKRVMRCKSPAGVLSLGQKISRELGRDGALNLSEEAQSFLHDIKRVNLGLEPISYTPAIIAKATGIPNEVAVRSIKLFLLAYYRLKRNAATTIVLSAAFLGFWTDLKKNERKGN